MATATMAPTVYAFAVGVFSCALPSSNRTMGSSPWDDPSHRGHGVAAAPHSGWVCAANSIDLGIMPPAAVGRWMGWVALKMLTGDRAKFSGIVHGLTFAALLITQQGSIFCGLMLRTAGQITDIRAPTSGSWTPTSATSTTSSR